MTNKAATLAKAGKVNVVQEINTEVSKFTRYKFETIMYRTSNSAIATYKAETDSIAMA